MLYSNNVSSKGKGTQKPTYQNKQKNKSVQKKAGKGNVLTCWICGGEGHFKRNCPKRGNQGNRENFKDKGESSAVTWVDYVESLMVSEANLSEGIDFKEVWILDTGCSFHMTPRKNWFVELKESSSGSVRMANESVSTVEGIRTIKVQTSDGRQVLIKNVRYIPQFSRNMLSLGTFEELGCNFKSENGFLEVIKENKSVLKAKRHNKLYFLQGKSCVGEANVAKAGDDTELWHSRLGHVSQKGLDVMVKKGYLDGKRVSTLGFCESCIFGKAHRSSYETGQHTSFHCLEYVHCDLWGSPNVPASLGKCHYFLSLVDDCSRKVWVYFLKIKDQTYEKLVEWKHLVENQSGLKVKKLRTDNGMELCNHEFDKFCSDNGIARHKRIPYTPQQNGVVERMNRTILERVRSVLSESGLPKVF